MNYIVSLTIVSVVAVISRLFFWLKTDWTIEDALIICRVSKNLIKYGEITYNIGERVSSCTSPLFTLMISAGSCLTGDPLMASKTLGIIASTITCILIFNLLCNLYKPSVAAGGTMFFAMLPPVVAYSVGGMETPVYTLVCFWAIERLVRKKRAVSFCLAAVATLLRPDGIIVMGVIFIFLIFEFRKTSFINILQTLSLGFLILAAGFGIYWLYYGSVIPNTVNAKNIANQVDLISNILKYINRMFLSQPWSLLIYMLSIYGTWRCYRKRSRFLIFPVWYVIYHVFFIIRAPLYSWYLQPPLAVLCLLAGIGFMDFVEKVFISINKNAIISKAQVFGGACVLAALLIVMFPYANTRIKMQQYENQVRRKAGEWLASNTDERSLVFTESLGYIGYFTENPFVDWPGLTSRKIPLLIQADMKRNNRMAAYKTIIDEYNPKYLALRSGEWKYLHDKLGERYRLSVEFNSSSKIGPGYIIAESTI